MNYIDYERQTTRKGELMSKEKPLIDYVNHRSEPQYQEGAGASTWIAVAVVCNILLVWIGVCYG